MNHDAHDEIQPELETMMEDYILLKRQGGVPSLDEFIRQYPSEHQQALREKIAEYEQFHRVFGAFASYQAEKFASEVSEARVNAAYENFQEQTQVQVLQIPANRDAIRTLCQRLLTLIAPEEAAETVRDIERLVNMAARGQVETVAASLAGGFGGTDKMVSVIAPVVFSAVNQLLIERNQNTIDALKTENAQRPIRKIKKRDIKPIVKRTKSRKGRRALRHLTKVLNNELKAYLES
jgi:hypothetical protein